MNRLMYIAPEIEAKNVYLSLSALIVFLSVCLSFSPLSLSDFFKSNQQTCPILHVGSAFVLFSD